MNTLFFLKKLEDGDVEEDMFLSTLNMLSRLVSTEGDQDLINRIVVVMLEAYVQYHQDGYDEDCQKTRIRVEILSLLNRIADDTRYHSVFVEGNAISILVDNMTVLPPSYERKYLLRIFSIIAENVWYRADIMSYLQNKFSYTISVDCDFVKNIMAKTIDFTEGEYFLDGLRCLDIVLDKYEENGKPFYDIDDHPICKILEAHYEEIKEELAYITSNDVNNWPEEYLCKEGWEVLGLFAFDNKISRGHNICPKTAEILKTVPGMTTALFSCLKPRTHIKPHIGYYQYSEKILRCHLGLVVPDGTILKCNGVEHQLQEGKCTLFDDTFRHEAWNPSYETTRIVLMVDVLYEGDNSVRSSSFLQRVSELPPVQDALVSQHLINALNVQGIESDSNFTNKSKYQ